MSFDDLHIEAGSYVEKPNAALGALSLPYPSVNLGNTAISIPISNNGNSAINSFTLTMKVNDNVVASENFTTTIAAGANDTITMNATVDMSQVGEYDVDVTISNVLGAGDVAEDDFSNNTTSAATHHLGNTTLPFYTDFTQGDPHHENWASINNTWELNDGGYLKGSNTENLISPVVHLEAGKLYRLNSFMKGGLSMIGMAIPSKYYVLLGTPGTDMSTWQGLNQLYEGLYTDPTEVDIDFYVPSTGDYHLAIKPYQAGSYIQYYSLKLEEVLPNEVRVIGTRTPSMLPTSQALLFPTDFSYVNKGYESANYKFTVREGDNEIGSLSMTGSTMNDTISATINTTPVAPEAGDVLYPMFNAEVVGFNDARVIVPEMQSIEITDSIYAIDRVTDELIETQSGSGYANRIGVGQLFRLSAGDDITGIRLIWAGNDSDENASICIYKQADNGSLGQRIYNENIVKTEGIGTVDYTIPKLNVEPGNYFVFVYYTGYLLGVDYQKDGIMYIHYEPTSGFSSQNTLGNPCIRLIFGGNDYSGVNDLNVQDSEIKFVKYYNIAGQEISNANKGISIQVTTLSNGNTITKKIVK